MIHKERYGDELYVYMNGSLLAKKAIGRESMVILGCPVFKNWRTNESFQHITDDCTVNDVRPHANGS